MKNKIGYGQIKYAISNSWDMPDLNNAISYNGAFSINKSTVISAQLFDKEGKRIGSPMQEYFQKIEPAYHYKVFGPAPNKGWNDMPDFTKLPVIREGISGFMTQERLGKINEELFTKVKEEGQIDVRFNGIYNPYAVELKGNIKIPSDGIYKFRIQTSDGLAELYINNKPTCVGKEFDNKPEDFSASLSAGTYPFTIKYFYRKIRNQLSIQYKTEEMNDFAALENIVQPIQ